MLSKPNLFIILDWLLVWFVCKGGIIHDCDVNFRVSNWMCRRVAKWQIIHDVLSQMA